MTKVYACLTGEWVCLNDDPNCIMGPHHTNPGIWYEEGAELWAPLKREHADRYYDLDYIYIHYCGKDYRIHPVFIQIVTD